MMNRHGQNSGPIATARRQSASNPASAVGSTMSHSRVVRVVVHRFVVLRTISIGSHARTLTAGRVAVTTTTRAVHVGAGVRVGPAVAVTTLGV